MKILKTFLFCGAFCACVGSAQADFLYWQVTLPTSGPGSKSNLESGHGAVAREEEDEGSGKLTMARMVAYTLKDGEINYDSVKYQYVQLDDSGNTEDAVAFDLSQLGDSASSYSFMIELGNATGTDNFYTMGSGSSLKYTDASSYIGTGGIVPAANSIWDGGTYAIPEPSSALMLLLGGSLLALRRRRK